MNSITADHPGIGWFIPSLSRAQKAFLAIALAITIGLSSFTAVKALHQHDYWWSPIDIPYKTQNSQGDASVQHFHDPYWQFQSDALHSYYDWPPADMHGAKSRYIYYGTYDSGWYLGTYSAYAYVNNGNNYITYADGVYTHKVNGAWTWIYYYSDLLLYP